MDYEKKYREALERAKESMKDGGISQNTIDYLQNIFPELAESEDEKIRRELLEKFKNSEDSFYMVLTPHKRESIIALLEKQGEHNRWKPSEEMLEALYRALPENTMAISEDEMLLDKLYQGLKYGRVLSNK